MAGQPELVSQEQIENAVLVLRGEKVLLDADLAALYGVEVKILNQAVKRNADRFPVDFMFQLNQEEYDHLRSQVVTSSAAPGALALRSQFVTLNAGRGKHRKYLPYAFTEQGIAMLSSVLRSPQAVRVNIEIMRTFVRLRKVLAVSAELGRRLNEVEQRLGTHDEQFVQVIRAIRQLMEPAATPARQHIGFHQQAGAASSKPAGSRGSANRTGSKGRNRAKKK